MGRTDGDKGEVQYTGHYAETDWLGICDPERIQKKKTNVIHYHPNEK